MAFDVLISDEAYADLDMLAGAIRRRSTPDVARKWFSSLIAAIDSLANMPERCALAPESVLLGGDVRVLLHGRRNRMYRVYFRVRRRGLRGVVHVLHIRHWARKPPEDEEML